MEGSDTTSNLGLGVLHLEPSPSEPHAMSHAQVLKRAQANHAKAVLSFRAG